MKQINSILLLFLMVFSSIAFGQLNPIGSWTDHLPYRTGTSIATDGISVFCATRTGLFSYNSEDNSVAKFSKVNLLNDVEIRKIAYSKEFKTLIVVYSNANIDLIKGNRVINIPFIKLSNESKQVNEIKVYGQLAYLSTAYGITLIDIVKNEIVDTYKFGANGDDININSTIVYNNLIYAASSRGIYTANPNNNLLDFNSWSLLPAFSTSNIKKLANYENGFLLVSKRNSISSDSLFKFDGNSHQAINNVSNAEFKSLDLTLDNKIIYSTINQTTIYDNTLNETKQLSIPNNITVGATMLNANRLFVANTFYPLLEYNMSDAQIVRSVRPDGPFEQDIFDIDVKNGQLWGVNGGHNSTYNNNFKLVRFYNYNGARWKNYVEYEQPNLSGVFDAISVTINPSNSNQVYFGSWGRGLVEFNQKENPFDRYDHTNSEIQVRQALASEGWSGIGEGVFDDEGNFWMANTYNVNGLCVRKANGSFKSFNLSNLYNGDETAVFDIEIDDNGFKWIALPKDNAIAVYDDNGTIDDLSDDRSILLTSEEGKGSIPGFRGIKIEKDKDGLIWIGTSDGIAVHFNPGGVFDGDLDFDRIIFFDGENNEIVLQNSTVSEIAIDGFNRKWIGTQNSGVLLLSEDGKETIHSFNESNSPLISNTINAISVDDKSGEVYFATAKGLVSYRGEAIGGSDNFNNVSVFPNPVRPNYEGKIAISGLIDNATVKITDISGTLINELKSEGGQVLWDGNNFQGRRASTGVYLILMSGEDEDGDLKTEVGKIMFVN